MEPETLPSSAVLQLVGPETARFLPIACAETVNGSPRRRFAKELIRVGKYVKDLDGDRRMEFEVTADSLKNWVAQFSRMRQNGVKVPIPELHQDADWEAKARAEDEGSNNRGWVDEMFVDGGSLMMACTLIGDDALNAAQRNDVSIHSPPRFVDGKGVEYVRPITHVAITPKPLIPGLGEFIPIAASRSGTMLKVLQKIAKQLGIEGELTEENAEGKISSAITALKKKSADVKASNEDDTDTGVKPGEGKPDGDGKPKQADPVLVKIAADRNRMKLDQLVAASKITPAVRDDLVKRWIGDGNTDVLAASLASGDDGSAFDGLCDALEKNDPVKLKEQTGPQTLELGGGNPGGDQTKESPIVASAKRMAEAEKGK